MEGNKRKKVIVAVGIVISYLVMYAIMVCLNNERTVMGYDDYKSIVTSLFPVIFLGLLIILIPFERIGYVWRWDFVYKFLGIRSSNLKITHIIGAICFYILAVVVGLGLNDLVFFGNILYTHQYSMLITWITLYIIIYSFELFESNVSLWIFDLFMVMANGFFICYYTYDLFEPFFVTLALGILWCILILKSKRPNKVIAIFSFILANILALLAAISLLGQWHKVDAWFEPEKYDIGWENLVMKGHTLQLPSNIDWGFAMRHPFSSIFSYLGTVPLILFILAFIGMGILAVYSKKLLTPKRYTVMLGLYILFATVFVYTFLADFGFAPTSPLSIIEPYSQILFLCLMIRLFLTRKVPKKLIEDCQYDEMDWLDDDNSDLYFLDKTYKIEAEITEILRYLFYLEIKNKSSGEEDEGDENGSNDENGPNDDNDDEYDEERKKLEEIIRTCPKSAIELASTIHDIKNGKKNYMNYIKKKKSEHEDD